MIRTRKRKSSKSSTGWTPEAIEVRNQTLQSQIDQLFKNYDSQQNTIREQTDSIECLTNDLKQTRELLQQLRNSQLKNKESDDLVRFETVENHEDSTDGLGEIGLASFDALKSPKKTVSQSTVVKNTSLFSPKTSQQIPTNAKFTKSPQPELSSQVSLLSSNLFTSDFDENLVEVHLEEDDDGYLLYPHMPGMADLYNCTITYRSSKIPNTYERRLAGYFFDLPPQTSFPDYYEICKNPMSLTIVKNRLRRKFYGVDGKDLKMLYDDLMLIFRNGCFYYLKRDRLIYDGCKGIQATLRRKLKTVGKQMGIENFESLKRYGTHYVKYSRKSRKFSSAEQK